MRTLAAGPWVGEFGVELFLWQGHIRSLAEQFDQTIVSGRASQKFLYQDFCRDYRTYASSEGPCAGFTNYTSKRSGTVHHTIRCKADYTVLGTQGTPDVVPTYIMYGEQSRSLHYDMVLATRDVQIPDRSGMSEIQRTMKMERNWGLERWKILTEAFKGKRMCSVGAPTSSLHIPGTDDLRGISLAELANVLASSTCIAGSSCGVLHFASLCGCPQFIWFGERGAVEYDIADRYYYDWNPFQTQAIILTRYEWQPEPEFVIDGIRQMEPILDSIPKRPAWQRVRHTSQRTLHEINNRSAVPHRNMPLPTYPLYKRPINLSL